MPDFEHFKFSCSRMNSVLGENGFAFPQNLGFLDSASSGHWSDPVGLFSSEHSGATGSEGLEMGAFPPPGVPYLHHFHRAPPAATTALRNDLGSNISVLKTLNLRFRCFLAKVHELERRNKILEKQLQQALNDHAECLGNKQSLTRDFGVQTGFVGFIPLHNSNDSAYLSPDSTNKTLAVNTCILLDSNSNVTPNVHFSPIDPAPVSICNMNGTHGSTPEGCPSTRFQPSSLWTYTKRFCPGRESWIPGSGAHGPWLRPPSDGVGVQIDTITPEIRALYNVLAKVKRERDEYKRRWEEEYTIRGDLQEKVAELQQDLQESEVCQEELALKVKQLKAELVLFRGLMSNNHSDLDSKIQEKAMKVDMDICRRIDITARLCDVAQQRNCEDMIQIFQQVATPPSTLSRRPRKAATQMLKVNESDEPISFLRNKQCLLFNRRECDFEDDCDSLSWEETEETLLLWEDFPGYSFSVENQGEQEESIEKVINDTESLFQSREKEYQETIDQIELELATAKSDMNRHLHEYMEMCSLKRGLDVQMETCRRLITQSGDRKSPILILVAEEEGDNAEKERKRATAANFESTGAHHDMRSNSSAQEQTWTKP
ncbi:hypothetical protein DNTS_009401 [Danionella cerebrum]|uniref:IF rod domain-containing protein n=1 Tax=Danionella cerebrum TaxID=2873325 RepID=A0A553R201_9TELE|nr:hypothetical protein DNTS_009401 [Danionella translucida]